MQLITNVQSKKNLDLGTVLNIHIFECRNYEPTRMASTIWKNHEFLTLCVGTLGTFQHLNVILATNHKIYYREESDEFFFNSKLWYVL
jgi:hypothetical protein